MIVPTVSQKVEMSPISSELQFQAVPVSNEIAAVRDYMDEDILVSGLRRSAGSWQAHDCHNHTHSHAYGVVQCVCLFKIQIDVRPDTMVFNLVGCTDSWCFPAWWLLVVKKRKPEGKCKRCNSIAWAFVRQLRVRLLAHIEKQYLADLSRDGDVELNPGPRPLMLHFEGLTWFEGRWSPHPCQEGAHVCPCRCAVYECLHEGMPFLAVHGCEVFVMPLGQALVNTLRPSLVAGDCRRCAKVALRFFCAWKQANLHFMHTAWVKDLTMDGDVESNPGPPPRWHAKALERFLQEIPSVAWAKMLKDQFLSNIDLHCCARSAIAHVVTSKCPTVDMNEGDTTALAIYFLDVMEAEAEQAGKHIKRKESNAVERPCSDLPGAPSPSASSRCPSSTGPKEEIADRPSHNEASGSAVSHNSEKEDPTEKFEVPSKGQKRISDKRRSRGGKRQTRSLKSQMYSDQSNYESSPASIEDPADMKILKYKEKTIATFLPRWKFLLELRDYGHFGNGAMDTFTFIDRALSDAWSGVNPTLWPTGVEKICIGWRAVYKENCTDVLPVLSSNGIRKAHGLRYFNGDSPKFIVGPLPYANKIGVFFDELWTHEHYNWLYENNYELLTQSGELAVYSKRGPIEVDPHRWWVEISRYDVILVERTSVMQAYWIFGERAKSAVFVDYEAPSLFPNGVWMHDGTFASAAGELERCGYTYCKYWPTIIQGTVIHQSARNNALNLQRLNSYRKDSEFHLHFRELFGYSSIADNLFHLLVTEEQLGSKNHHPIVGGQFEHPDDHNDNLINPTNRTFEEVQDGYINKVEGCKKFFSEVKESIWPEDDPDDLMNIEWEVDDPECHQTRLERRKKGLFDVLTDSLPNPGPGILSYLAGSLLKNRDPKEDYINALHESRKFYYNCNNAHAEYRASTAASFTVSLPNYPQKGCWRLEQANSGAIIDGVYYDYQKAPPYDPERLEVAFHGQNDWHTVCEGGQRPEVLYWIYCVSFFIPSPQAAMWTCVYRTGKPGLEADAAKVRRFVNFWRDNMDVWLRPMHKRDEGGLHVTMENYAETLENMPGDKRAKHLEYLLGVHMGMVRHKEVDFQFHCKSDEVNFLELRCPDNDLGLVENFDAPNLLYLNGKPRHIFAATTYDMSYTQGALYDLKKMLKAIEPAEELPNAFVVILKGERTDVAIPCFMTYGADLDNVQEGLWYTAARNKQGIHVLVGGDDNFIIICWQGFYIEFEGDISMCDQSHKPHFRDLCLEICRQLKMASDVIDLMGRTYTKQAHFVHKRERMATIKYKDCQLKTGVGHTSVFNTLTITSLIAYCCQYLVWYYEYYGDFGTKEMISQTMVEESAALGMKLKAKCWVAPACPMATYHKRYFVWSSAANEFVACPLPGTTLMKMCKVRCGQRSSWKRARKILIGGAESRKHSSQSPPVRALINNLLRQGHAPAYTDNPYSSLVRPDPTHLEKRGDGDRAGHVQFFNERYGIGESEMVELEEFYGSVQIDMGYNLAQDYPFIHRLLLKMWEVDCQ